MADGGDDGNEAGPSAPACALCDATGVVLRYKMCGGICDACYFKQRRRGWKDVAQHASRTLAEAFDVAECPYGARGPKRRRQQQADGDSDATVSDAKSSDSEESSDGAANEVSKEDRGGCSGSGTLCGAHRARLLKVLSKAAPASRDDAKAGAPHPLALEAGGPPSASDAAVLTAPEGSVGSASYGSPRFTDFTVSLNAASSRVALALLDTADRVVGSIPPEQHGARSNVRVVPQDPMMLVLLTRFVEHAFLDAVAEDDADAADAAGAEGAGGAASGH